MVYALAVLILLGVGLNALSRRYILYNLSYKREISKKVVEIEEEFEVATVVENKKFLPVTFLQIVEKFPPALNYKSKANVLLNKDYILHKSTMLIMPYQRIKRRYRVFCSRRGRLIFRDVTLTGGDLLGFDTASESMEYYQDMVVLPRAIDLENAILPYGDYNGDFSVRRWIIEDPVLTAGIREYTGSEPLKTIHWLSSLKSGRLMVKKFDYTADNTVMVVLNTECSKPFWAGIEGEKIEKCISMARSVIEQFEEAGIPYGLSSDAYFDGIGGGGSIDAAGFGTAHYYNVLESLGRLDYNIRMPFEELLSDLAKDAGSYTTFVIITPSVLEPYIDSINSLGEQAVRVVLISLKQENLEHLGKNILTFVERRD